MLDIFEFNIIKRAFLVVSFIATIAPICGIFLLFRKYAFFADTIAHVGFLAIALSLFFKINSLVLLILLSIGVSISVEYLRARGRLPAEGSLSFFLYAGVALSVLFITFSGSTGSIMNILFGSLSTVTKEDVYLVIAGTFVCGIFILRYYKKLINFCIDEELAHASGVNIAHIKILFAITVALSVSISIKTMGAFLIGSLLIIPPLIAMQICKSFRNTVIASIIISLLSSYLGIFLSFYSGIPLGASISTILIVFFVISFIIKVFKFK